MNYTLITGASGGIGLELAYLFAKDGHNLILVARSGDKLASIKDELERTYGISAQTAVIDLSEKGAADELFKLTEENGFKIDNLVNNAGFANWGAFLDSDWDRQQRLMTLNSENLVRLTYLYGRAMKAAGAGRILNVASVAAFCAGPYMSLYYASKSFVVSFSQAVHEELLKTGVTVTCVCPGPTVTDFEKRAEMKNSRMFTFFRPASAKSVAKRSYRAMQKGKPLVYHSYVTKLGNIASRLLSRRIGRKFAKFINGKDT